MIEIKVHSVIDSEIENQNAQFFGYQGQDMAFSLDSLQRIIDEHPDDNELRLNIHCDGGSVSEGLAIYDALRNSGKTIYANIEGSCHSMAVVLLLAAPKENRSANPNCRALIHKVAAPACGFHSADDYRTLADEIEREQENILDIYADRTGSDKEFLRGVMNEEKQRTAEELLEWGFISKINIYSTNQKQNKMAQTKLSTEGLITKIQNFFNSLSGVVNFDHVDNDGNILFSTEKEDDSLAIGDAASPDGTHELPDGRKVTIESGVITAIEEPQEDEPQEQSTEELDNLKAENDNLKNEVEQLKAQLSEATNLLTAARNELQSSYSPKKREINPRQNVSAVMTAEEITNQARETRKKMGR